MQPFDDDEPIGTLGWTALSGWTEVHRGLNLYYKAILSLIVIVLGGFVLTLVLAAIGAAGLALVVLFLIAVAVIVVQVLVVVGVYQFTSVPRETGAKGLAWVALSCLVVATAVGLFDLFSSLDTAFEEHRRFDRRDPGTWESLARMTSSFGFFFLVLSTRAVAKYVGAFQDLRNLNVVLVLLLAFAGWVLTLLVAPGAVVSLGTLASILSFGLSIGVLVAAVLFLVTVGSLRDMIMVNVLDYGDAGGAEAA